jgi:aminocarboxymuconate-semialdehyde decarboxylase
LAIERNIINEDERDAIWGNNVIQWLYGEDEEGKQKLITRILS